MTSNYSLYAIPALWVMGLLPHAYASQMTKSTKDMPEFDNVSPRAFLVSVANQEKQTPFIARYLRTEAASQNTLEQIGLFGVSILAGNLAGLPAADMNKYAGFYLATRALYTFLYVSTTQNSLSYLRSVVFVSGVGTCFTMLIKAGNALNRSIL